MYPTVCPAEFVSTRFLTSRADPNTVYRLYVARPVWRLGILAAVVQQLLPPDGRRSKEMPLSDLSFVKCLLKFKKEREIEN